MCKVNVQDFGYALVELRTHRLKVMACKEFVRVAGYQGPGNYEARLLRVPPENGRPALLLLFRPQKGKKPAEMDITTLQGSPLWGYCFRKQFKSAGGKQPGAYWLTLTPIQIQETLPKSQ